MVSRTQTRPIATFVAALLLFHSDFSCSAGPSLFAPRTEIEVRGTVRFVSANGGCWQLQAQNGARYELRPGQAPSRVLIDGAQVLLLIRLRTDLASPCRVGDIVDVQWVESVQVPSVAHAGFTSTRRRSCQTG